MAQPSQLDRTDEILTVRLSPADAEAFRAVAADRGGVSPTLREFVKRYLASARR